MGKKFNCRKVLGAGEYQYCMKPDAFVDFLDNVEHERLQKYQQNHLNKHNDLVRSRRMFDKDLKEAARLEIKRCLDGTVDIDAEYEHMEFMALLGLAIDSQDQFFRVMDIDLKQMADVLDVTVPPEMEEVLRASHNNREYYHGAGSDSVIKKRLDLILNHLGIEVPED